MKLTSNCDVTNSAHQMTTIWPWTKAPWKFSAYATDPDLRQYQIKSALFTSHNLDFSALTRYCVLKCTDGSLAKIRQLSDATLAYSRSPTDVQNYSKPRLIRSSPKSDETAGKNDFNVFLYENLRFIRIFSFQSSPIPDKICSFHILSSGFSCTSMLLCSCALIGLYKNSAAFRRNTRVLTITNEGFELC